MQRITCRLKPPSEPYTGNLLWNANEVVGFGFQIAEALTELRTRGYWASPFPEGDGVTFYDESKLRTNEQIARDISECFPWLDVHLEEPQEAPPPPQHSFPSLGYTETETLLKFQIALEQLEDAIDLFLSGRWLSSLTLAAAADGIFAGLLTQRGQSTSAEETWREIEKVRATTGFNIAGDRKESDAFREWNWFQNRLKHHDKRDEEHLTINQLDHAYYAIERARADAKKLAIYPNNTDEYDAWLIQNIFT